MSKVICEREDLVAIADSVREKTGSSEQMTLGEIKAGIDNLSSGDSGGGGSDSSDTSYNMVTVVNNTGADITIGLYRLSNGESVQLPYNLSDFNVPVSFITTMEENTFVNSSASTMPTSVEKVSVGIGSSDSGSSVPLTTGYLILLSSWVGSTLEISLA